ncbi:MAG: S-layer homology domain-containing protein [Clostridiales bacterium]|jgi:hypothetical protein|nr:S-layer homology domain-containing protein [Clostridiales bacterium]
MKKLNRNRSSTAAAALGLALCLLFTNLMNPQAAQIATVSDFSDVPKTHWAYADIQALRNLQVTQGIGDNLFGLGKTITRAEFITFLAKLFNWEASGKGEAWYSPFIAAGVKNGAITPEEEGSFRPNDPITREEMAVILVRSMGYGSLAQQLDVLPAPFLDVAQNIGCISMAKDFGIIYGVTPTSFAPSQTATREQAAAMMVRLYNKQASASLSGTSSYWKNISGYYAISSSSQSSLIPSMDTISFGWCRIEWKDGVHLNFNSSDGNDYHRPSGFEQVLASVKAQGKRTLLMVSVEGKLVTASGGESGSSGDMPLSAYLLSRDSFRIQMVQQISSAAQDYGGVLIDFENMKGEQAKNDLNVFLTQLKAALAPQSNYLAVTVQPARLPGEAYFDAYDFKGIGDIADQIVLMAHDYAPKSLSDAEMKSGFMTTPLTPINEIYYALKAITDPESGVSDPSKISFQISFASTQWKALNGEIINKTPFTPAYDAIYARIAQGVTPEYSSKYENPYLLFTNEEDGTENMVWYENSRSVSAKLKLAALFGISNVSLWRLGTIPQDVIPLFAFRQ